jgi:hypothetical protein
MFARPGSALADSGLAQTSRAVVEELDELRPLALGETANGLRLADPALIEQTRRLDPTELGHGHEHVEDLRRRDVLGGVEKDVLDALSARLQVPFELCAADSNIVRPLKSFHPLVERARRCLRVRLRRDHEPDESTKTPSLVKRERFSLFAGVFALSSLSTEHRESEMSA